MLQTVWTDELDCEISRGFSEGMSAREIGEKIGKTRNAILGRAFRLNLERAPLPPKPREVAPQRIIKTMPHLTDAEIAERIADGRDLGTSWQKLAEGFEIDILTVRIWAKKLGVFEPSGKKQISENDLRSLCDAWNRGDAVEDIAELLGRSFGVIRQTILRLQRTKRIGSRDPAKTRLLKQYGAAALSKGATPREALRAMQDAKVQAFANAINAASAAKRRFKDIAMDAFRQSIANGEERNAVIFAARAAGVSLKEIGDELGVTRERIRQVCNEHAKRLAIAGLLAS